MPCWRPPLSPVTRRSSLPTTRFSPASPISKPLSWTSCFKQIEAHFKKLSRSRSPTSLPRSTQFESGPASRPLRSRALACPPHTYSPSRSPSFLLRVRTGFLQAHPQTPHTPQGQIPATPLPSNTAQDAASRALHHPPSPALSEPAIRSNAGVYLPGREFRTSPRPIVHQESIAPVPPRLA